jgi:DNA-binding NtrC family response regulator
MSDAPILLLGESGTGKELAARAVHDHSGRKDGPFVVFDCGAASESLIEGELFGHKRGAFTGAHADRAGAFARAHGGTLFLDEIGDLPQTMQPKLLRLLERGEVTPLGGTRSERYDVRFVAATHRDVWGDVGRGTFRGDLYYRLAVVEVQLPPLRSHVDDIASLTVGFLRAAGASTEGVEGPPLERLRSYGWPGNVRELRNVVTRAATLAPPGASFDRMPLLFRPSTANIAGAEPTLARADVPYHDAKAALLERFDKEYLGDLLRRAGDNLSQAARIAGLERKYLYKLLERASLFPQRRGS